MNSRIPAPPPSADKPVDPTKKVTSWKTHVRVFDMTNPDHAKEYAALIDSVMAQENILRWEKMYDAPPGALMVSWMTPSIDPAVKVYSTPEVHINPETGEPYLTQPKWPRGLPPDYAGPLPGASTDELRQYLKSKAPEEPQE